MNTYKWKGISGVKYPEPVPICEVDRTEWVSTAEVAKLIGVPSRHTNGKLRKLGIVELMTEKTTKGRKYSFWRKSDVETLTGRSWRAGARD